MKTRMGQGCPALFCTAAFFVLPVCAVILIASGESISKMKKSRAIIGAIVSLAAAFGAAVAAIDFDGYNFFDRPDGGNALCRIDPDCRFLTPGEVDVARTVFGGTIDYKKVKVFTRPLIFWKPPPHVSARMWNGNIYIFEDQIKTADFATRPAPVQKAYLHELTHVWQYANDPKFLAAGFFALLKRDFDYDALYGYDIEDHKYFADFNFEQQGEIIEDYYDLRTRFRDVTEGLVMKRPADFRREFNVWARAHCKALDRYAATISTSLPQPLEPKCAMYRPYERPNMPE